MSVRISFPHTRIDVWPKNKQEFCSQEKLDTANNTSTITRTGSVLFNRQNRVFIAAQPTPGYAKRGVRIKL